ncbi:MAG: hypothetical protein RRY13_08520 [Akkermansia sp.]
MKILLSLLLVFSSWLMTSCSSDCLCQGNGVSTIAKVSKLPPNIPWYRCGKIQSGATMYYTNARISWTFDHQLGYWQAFGAKNKALNMTAAGKTFTIEKNYGWDGATKMLTTPKLLTPTLFHDALLHAMMNGAPITRDQADGAFYQLMKKENFTWSKMYYLAVKEFGASYLEQQNPPTLIIKRTKK